MATRKKETAKAATLRAAETEDPIDYPANYIRFRTALDSLEALALRYSLKDPNPVERMKRMKEIEEKYLMPFIKEYSKNLRNDIKQSQISGDCPDGFNNCGGCCVPYQCP